MNFKRGRLNILQDTAKLCLDKSQRCNHGEIFGATSAMLGRICPPSWNRVKASKNFVATVVAPVVLRLRPCKKLCHHLFKYFNVVSVGWKKVPFMVFANQFSWEHDCWNVDKNESCLNLLLLLPNVRKIKMKTIMLESNQLFYVKISS